MPIVDGAPHVVTSLAVRRGRSDRTVVTLEDGSRLELASILVEGAGLRAGAALDELTLARLVCEDEPHRARSRALHFLASRDRSRCEVETRLRGSGFGSEVIADTIAWLESLAYLDDRRFAERYAEEKLQAGWGPRRINSELLRKGVERTLAQEVMEADDGSTEARVEGEDAAMRRLFRRFSKEFEVDPQGVERRAAGYLARRGYDWDAVARMVRELRDECSE